MSKKSHEVHYVEPLPDEVVRMGDILIPGCASLDGWDAQVTTDPALVTCERCIKTMKKGE